MEIAGQNLYRVYYKIDKIKDMDFQKMVVAYSDKEAIANVKHQVLKVTLVDTDISLVIPNQYLKEAE